MSDNVYLHPTAWANKLTLARSCLRAGRVPLIGDDSRVRLSVPDASNVHCLDTFSEQVALHTPAANADAMGGGGDDA